MTRRLCVGCSIVGAVVALLLVARGVPRGTEALAAPADEYRSILSLLRGPDTTSTDWKRLSRDVALELHDDAYYGVRARLYVRVDGRWTSVGIDSPADIAQIVPAR